MTRNTDGASHQTARPATLTRSEAPTMRAIVQHAYGTADVLHLERIERPAIKPDEVLIRVRAAGVNHADWVYTSGRPLLARLAFGLRKPKQPVRGRDVAGVVEAVGEGVTRFRPNDAVFGEVDGGSFAEYTVARQDLLALKPVGLTFEQAAVVPVSARTALQGLRDTGKLRPGQSVLINGASGGVGTFAVQIARALGAEVTGVCSRRNVELVRSLGADQVIDYTYEDFTRSGRRYDLIFDSIGNHSINSLRRALTPTGTLVLSSGTGGRVLGPMGRIIRARLLSLVVGQTLTTGMLARSTETLDELRALFDSGAVTPVIERTYPLSETADAVRHFAEEHARAKIAITVSAAE
ncbi:NAD(P)-dependent alcohol dehydrogenase [Cryobacterium sp. PH31-AA6]|uniref:NAD(P)-dependent alcohol dehydrogenase n=1 Tax=Cryobacterium sp. PH31-AA6 TaxID=3046205 RepID=UPI0024B88655|nr:NAD(P)-dependent alcohol dehydrogenase [Cryobacterium sp. PH31-AA6]MDJ0322417.1 NAD(P)-dependent alcohol dehydrogenase [Cryobacterium sp. PH31-AA6]